MGGLVDSIFGGGGGKAAKKAAGFQKDVFEWGKTTGMPFITGGQNAFGAMGNILGLGGTEEQDAAFNNYMNSTGTKFLLDQGSRAITGSNAAKGLLKSGSTAKALTQFGQNLASTKIAEYMGMLGNMSGTGANVLGNTLSGGIQTGANVAQTKMAGAQSKADAWGSLFNLGMSIAGAASERRLKRDIEYVGTLASGLGLYLYHYIWGGPLQWGVMVDEVARLRPQALGAPIGDVNTVLYGEI